MKPPNPWQEIECGHCYIDLDLDGDNMLWEGEAWRCFGCGRLTQFYILDTYDDREIGPDNSHGHISNPEYPGEAP